MSTQRIDIDVDVSGNYYFDSIPEDAWINEDDRRSLTLPTGQWHLSISPDNDKLRIKCFSKANPNKKGCGNRNLVPGSIFFVNTNNDFYWYFREYELQKFLDRYNINKMQSISCDNERRSIVQYNILEIGDSTNPNAIILKPSHIKKFESVALCTRNVVIHSVKPRAIIPIIERFGDGKTKEIYIMISDIEYSFNKFMLVKDRSDHITLWVNKGIRALQVQDYLQDYLINWEYPIPHLISKDNFLELWKNKREIQTYDDFDLMYQPA